MPFATKEQRREYERVRRERQRDDPHRQAQLRAAVKRYRAGPKYRGRVLAKDRLREPATIPEWRGALRWDRLKPHILAAMDLEHRRDARDFELSMLSEVWAL